jgi:NADH:ubiquinone oxidoreductase subunit 6 (subunit J)
MIDRFLRWINVGSGSLMVASTWLFAMPTSDARWDVRITGAVTIVTALIIVRSLNASWSANAAVIEMFAGIWLLLSTTFVHGDLVAVWSNIILGLMTVGVATLTYERDRASVTRTPPRKGSVPAP